MPCKELLDDNATNQTSPQFGEDVALDNFKDAYSPPPPPIFSQPDWMPSLQAPIEELSRDEINAGELLAAIKHTKSTSSPSPFDQITYTVFKQCRSLGKALLNLFNCCWSQAVIPPEWKLAAIKTVGKSSALKDPTMPANFCPIALTSCVGKLFTTILKN